MSSYSKNKIWPWDNLGKILRYTYRRSPLESSLKTNSEITLISNKNIAIIWGNAKVMWWVFLFFCRVKLQFTSIAYYFWRPRIFHPSRIYFKYFLIFLSHFYCEFNAVRTDKIYPTQNLLTCIAWSMSSSCSSTLYRGQVTHQFRAVVAWWRISRAHLHPLTDRLYWGSESLHRTITCTCAGHKGFTPSPRNFETCCSPSQREVALDI